MKILLILVSSLILFLFGGCKHHTTEPVPDPTPPMDSIYNPPLSGQFELCYMKVSGGNWNIFTSGTSPRNISQLSGISPPYGYDDSPRWSPNGRYIAFMRNGYSIVVYDLQTGTDTCVTSDGGSLMLPLVWTRDGHLCLCYRPASGPTQRAAYLVNPDGSGKRKILEPAPSAIFFYDDGHRFVYKPEGSNTWYRSDLDHTSDELVLETPGVGKPYITVRDFDGSKGEFLVNTNTLSGISGSALATYNIDTKQLKLLLAPQDHYDIEQERYSLDYTQLIFEEYGTNGSYLSVFVQGAKKRLLALPRGNPSTFIGSSPMGFSSDGKYVAFCEAVVRSGGWLQEQVYVIELATRALQHIDVGAEPSWNLHP